MLRRANQQKIMKALFVTLAVLIVMLIGVLAIIVTSGNATITEVMEKGKFVQGVTVAGIDVAGMTYDEAAADTRLKDKAKQLYDGFSYKLNVQGNEFEFTAAELGLENGLAKALEKAIAWGNTGPDKAEQADAAKESGKDFSLMPYADKAKVSAALQLKKSEFDISAKDATIKFDESTGTNENIVYVDEIDGVDVNISSLSQAIADNINNGDLSVIEAATEEYAIITPPRVTSEDLKSNITLIGTFTSYFNKKGLYDPDRVNNIVLMGAVVNGTVIEPGEIWSINDAAGPRDANTAKTIGWTLAHGLSNGRVEDEYGGGVCQISSTTFNAAIRAELVIKDRRPHSWPSDYIEVGFDATISTGGPDLKLQNPYDYPVFLACHVDTEAKSATVNVYGPPNPNGYTVAFMAQKVKTTNPPATDMHYNATQTPDGEPIKEGATVTWVEARTGYEYIIWKWYEDAEGNQVGDRQQYMTTMYRTIQGVKYVNGPDPALATAAPSAAS